MRARAGGVFAINVDRGDGSGFRPPPPNEGRGCASAVLGPESWRAGLNGSRTERGEHGWADGVDAVVPSRAGLSHKPAVDVSSHTVHDDGTRGSETYRDKAGRRRRRHLASPEARRARNAKARELHGLGKRIREIAHELGCGHGTVERALKEH